MTTPMDKVQESVMTLPFDKLMHALETAAKLALGKEHALTTGLSLMKENTNAQYEDNSRKVWTYVEGEVAKLAGEPRRKFFMYVTICINAVNLMHERSN